MGFFKGVKTFSNDFLAQVLNYTFFFNSDKEINLTEINNITDFNL